MAAALTGPKFGWVGLLGTRAVMESHLWGAIPTLEVVLPEGDDLAATHDAYIAMATASRVSEAQRELFFRIGADLVQGRGAEVVVLAGTDLCLAFDGIDCGFPVVDCAQVHVDALVRATLGDSLDG